MKVARLLEKKEIGGITLLDEQTLRKLKEKCPLSSLATEKLFFKEKKNNHIQCFTE